MSIRLNEDKEVVNAIREGLAKKGGYCPCRLEKTPDTKCMCKEFRDQIADPEFDAWCDRVISAYENLKGALGT